MLQINLALQWIAYCLACLPPERKVWHQATLEWVLDVKGYKAKVTEQYIDTSMELLKIAGTVSSVWGTCLRECRKTTARIYMRSNKLITDSYLSFCPLRPALCPHVIGRMLLHFPSSCSESMCMNEPGTGSVYPSTNCSNLRRPACSSWIKHNIRLWLESCLLLNLTLPWLSPQLYATTGMETREPNNAPCIHL